MFKKIMLGFWLDTYDEVIAKHGLLEQVNKLL